jgi:hypothetical protein
MDLHVPEGPIRSFRDFLSHLGIVTLGILIALGLEQLVEAHHQRRLATEAVAAFRRELADNRQDVKEVMDAMPDLRTRIQAEVAKLTGPRPADTPVRLKIEYPGIHLDLLSSASWDTAVATQALNELPYDEVRRYAEAFGVFHLFLDEERAGLGIWQDLRRFGDDPAALTPDQQRDMIEQFRRYESYTYTIDTIGKGALQSCAEALK